MDLAAIFQKGLALHHAGRLAEAREVYGEVLRADPQNFDSLHCLAIIDYQQGSFPEAVRRLDRALKINGTVAEAYNTHGAALEALKRHKQAIASFDRAIALNPNYAEAHNNRGSAQEALGHHQDAIACFDRAIALNPSYAEAYNNRGKAFGAAGSYDKALADFDRTTALRPDFAEAHFHRGTTLILLERYDAAVETLRRATMLKPDHAETIKTLAMALMSSGRHGEALTALDRAITLDPRCAESHNNRGIVLRGLARQSQALENFERAVTLNPGHVEALNNKAVVLFETGRLQEALAVCDRAIKLQVSCANAHYTRAITLEALGRPEAAIASYDKSLTYEPGLKLVAGKRVHTLMQICRWKDIEQEFQSLRQQVEAGFVATPPFPILAVPSSLAQQKKAAELYSRDQLPTDKGFTWASRKRAGRKIRIGYFSADFYNHATAYLAAGLFELHDRSQFEVIGFSFAAPIADDMTRRLNTAFDRLIDVSGKSDVEVAALARDLNIDIAIDLKGHTRDSRPGIFIAHAAPIQVSYLGYPGTMGMECIDYLIADPILIPPEHRPHYVEKIAYLPHSYQVNDAKRVMPERMFTRAELGLPETGFVFCCFNSSYKLTPDVFGVWMKLLADIDGSVLWLLESNPIAATNLHATARQHGIAPDRIIFAKHMGPAEHLARHQAADLFLDTFHCGAHTTASDALWAGLPVLTKLGDTFAGRVAAGLLTAVGLEDQVTPTAEAYAARAVDLATHPEQLAALKQRLEENKRSYPLFDTARFTRNIEAAYGRMMEIYESGKPAAHFHVIDDGGLHANGQSS